MTRPISPCPRLHTTDLMVLAAVRYCLGRSSYIVGDCVDWLPSQWAGLSLNTRRVLLRDIEEELRGSVSDRHAGFSRQAWQSLLDTLCRVEQRIAGRPEPGSTEGA